MKFLLLAFISVLVLTVPIEIDKQYRINSYFSHNYLAVEDSSSATGAMVISEKVGESSSDIWTFKKDTNDNWIIRNAHTGNILTIDNALHTEGAKARMWYDIGTDAPDQRWIISEYENTRPNAFQFRALHSGKCLRGDTYPIQQTKCQDISKGNEQVFYLFPVGENVIESGTVNRIVSQSSTRGDVSEGYHLVVSGLKESGKGDNVLQYHGRHDETDSFELFQEESGLWTFWYSPSHLAIAPEGAHDLNGAKLIQKEDSGTDEFRWDIIQIETGWFIIKNQDNGRCVTTSGNGENEGHVDMTLGECNYSPQQLFKFGLSDVVPHFPREIIRFETNSVHQFEIVDTGMLLDVQGAANDEYGHYADGNNVVQYTHHEDIVHLHDASQLWEFVPGTTDGYYHVFNVYTNKVLYNPDSDGGFVVQYDDSEIGGRDLKMVEILPHQYHIVNEYGYCFKLDKRIPKLNVYIKMADCGEPGNVEMDMLFRVQNRGQYKDIQIGVFYYIEVKSTDLYVDINGAKDNSEGHNDNGNYLIQTYITNEHAHPDAQKWSFEDLGDGTYTIHNKYSGRVIFVDQWNIQIGSHGYVMNNLYSDNKAWEMIEIEPSIFQIYHRRVKECMAIDGSYSGVESNLILSACDPADAKTLFMLREVAEEEKKNILELKLINAPDLYSGTRDMFKWSAENQYGEEIAHGEFQGSGEENGIAGDSIRSVEEVKNIDINVLGKDAWVGKMSLNGVETPEICLSMDEVDCDAPLQCEHTVNSLSSMYALESDANDPIGFNIGSIKGDGYFDDGGYKFTGSSNFIEIDNQWGGDFSISMWMRTSTNSLSGSQCYQGNGLFWSDIGGASDDFIFGILSDKICFFTGNPDRSALGTTELNDDKWHHVVGTRKMGEKVRVYVDGKFEGERETGSQMLTKNSRVHIGGNTLDSRYFDGLIKDVRVFSDILSDEDVLAMYDLECEIWMSTTFRGDSCRLNVDGSVMCEYSM